MEWMPIRRIPNSDITTITQVIEWGDLASIVALDTRLTSRSAEPTLSSYFEPFLLSTFSETNITAYYDESSEVRKGFEAISESVKTLASNPESTMIGEENKNLVRRKTLFVIYSQHNNSIFYPLSLIGHPKRLCFIERTNTRFLTYSRTQNLLENLGKSSLPL